MFFSGVELELFTREDMFLFVESAIRGGISMISKRLATSNVPGSDTYDPSKPPIHLKYLDANNLYGKFLV